MPDFSSGVFAGIRFFLFLSTNLSSGLGVVSHHSCKKCFLVFLGPVGRVLAVEGSIGWAAVDVSPCSHHHPICVWCLFDSMHPFNLLTLDICFQHQANVNWLVKVVMYLFLPTILGLLRLRLLVNIVIIKPTLSVTYCDTLSNDTYEWLWWFVTDKWFHCSTLLRSLSCSVCFWQVHRTWEVVEDYM